MHAIIRLIVATCYFTTAIGYQLVHSTHPFLRSFIGSSFRSIRKHRFRELQDWTPWRLLQSHVFFSLYMWNHMYQDKKWTFGIVVVVADSNALSQVRYSVGPFFDWFDTDFESSRIEFCDDCNNHMCYFLFTCESTCIEIRSAHLWLLWLSPNPTHSVRCSRIWNFVSSRHFWR